VAAVGEIVKKKNGKQLYTKRDTMHKAIEKHGTHKIENTYKTRKQT